MLIILGTMIAVVGYLIWSFLAIGKYPVPHMDDEWYWEGDLEQE